MLIRRVAVENFRKLRDPVEINDLQPGLNVIIGDNEEGKSTLLKAVQAAMFDKHNLTGQAVEAMLPLGSIVQPKVEVDFQLREDSYSLRKGFKLAPFAKLRNAGKSWENAAAEDKLKEIFGFTPPKQGPAKGENRGLSDLLWVEQGRAHEPLTPNKDAKTALDQVIESEVETAIGGNDGRNLLDAIRSECGNYYTPIAEQEKKILAEQRELVESLEHEIENLGQEKGRYDDKLNDLDEMTRILPGIQKDFDQAQREVNAIRAKVGEIEEIEKKITVAQEALGVANSQFQIARERLQTRRDKVDRLTKQEGDAKERGEEFSKLRKKHKEAKHQLDQAKNKLRQAQLESEKAKLGVVEGIATMIAENKKAVKKIPIEDKDVDKLNELESVLKVQRAKLEAMATTIVFSPSGNQSVAANGEALAVGEPCRITEKTLFELEEFGQLEVTPGGDEEDMHSCRSLVNDIDRRLHDGLASLGYPSIEAAKEAHGKKEELLGKIRNDEAKLEGLAPNGLEGILSDIDRLQREPPPITDTMESVLSVAEAERLQKSAQAEFNDLENNFSGIQNRLNIEQGALQQQRANVAELIDSLEEDRREISDKKLAKLSEKARKARNKRQRKVDRLKDELKGLGPNSTREKIDGKEQSFNWLERSLNATENEKRDLEAELRGLGTIGLGEKISEKCRKMQDARRELKRLELDANAWKLLLHTLLEAQEEERAPLTPLIRCLAPYVKLVFPSAKVHLDENSLKVGNLRREHSVEPESFASLSIGTREQVAVLVRLAMADVLREQGKPVMLILDDPLVNSDDTRFEGMSRALRKAAKHLQILILTCHADRYQPIGAKTIRLMEPKNQTSIVDLLAMPNAERIDFEPARLSDDLGKPADLS